MKLQTVDFNFTLLTPCFSGTALGKHADRAEMRVPPIRGHVRFWHRELFGLDDCNRVWGSTAGNQPCASRVGIVLVGGLHTGKTQAHILPHDLQKSGRPRPSLPAGTAYTIQLQRLVSCTDTDWDHAQSAVKTWLLLGCIGLRSNRAAGSVWPTDGWAPVDVDSLRSKLTQLGLRNWTVAVIGAEKGKTPDELRKAASDTIQGNKHIHLFGGIKPRTPSPTRFKVIRLNSGYCLLACAKNHGLLQQAELVLRQQKPNKQPWEALGQWRYLCR